MRSSWKTSVRERPGIRELTNLNHETLAEDIAIPVYSDCGYLCRHALVIALYICRAITAWLAVGRAGGWLSGPVGNQHQQAASER